MQGVRSVLVVDDSESLLEGYKRRLERSWFVYAASCPYAALAIAAEHTLTAAILDLHLEHGTSLPVLRQLKHHQPGLKVAVVSGYLTTESIVAAVQAGADAVIDKPIHPHEVLHRLELGQSPDVPSRDTPSLAEAIDAHIARVYADCGGNVSETARRLGIYRSSLQRRLRKNAIRLV